MKKHIFLSLAMVLLVLVSANQEKKHTVHHIVCKRTDGEMKWHISFSFSFTRTSSSKSDLKTLTQEEQMSGSTEMVIGGQLPDPSGNIRIATEDDSILSYSSSGSSMQTTRYIEKNLDGSLEEKRNDDYSGSVSPEKPNFGFEFEYNPVPGEIKAVNTGMRFSRQGKSETWQYSSQALNPHTVEDVSDNPSFLIGRSIDIVKKVRNGFTIDCSFSEDTTYEGNMGSHEESHAKTEYHVTIFPEINFKAYIVSTEDSSSYHQWLPEGPDPKLPASTGNALSFKVYVTDKTKPGQKLTDIIKSVRYQLENVSHEPGYAMNYPSKNISKKADLQLCRPQETPDTNVEKLSLDLQRSANPSLTAVVQCFDYGAYGKLKAIVTLTTGDVLTAVLEGSQQSFALIPYRKNESSMVADYWKEQNKATELADNDDDESDDNLKNNSYKGDGYSLYEEYRGFIENQMHIRTDPHKKDVMICDKVRDALIAQAKSMPSSTPLEKIQQAALPGRSQDGIDLFGAVTGFITHSKFKAEEFGIDKGSNIYSGVQDLDTLNLPVFTNNKVLNFNTSGYTHLHEQSGLLLLPSPKSLGYAAAYPKNANNVRPLKDWYCLVITADFSAKMEGFSSVTGDSTILNKTGETVVNPLGGAKITVDEFAVTVAHEMLHYCNVKHHGDIGESNKNFVFGTSPGEPSVLMAKDYQSPSTRINLFWDDLKATPITPGNEIFKNPSNSISVRIRAQGGTCSGVEDCIMRYDDAQAYEGADGNYYLLLDWKKGYSELTGIKLCTSKTGTGVNDKNHKPRPRYGDATNGNCQSQVCINDKYD